MRAPARRPGGVRSLHGVDVSGPADRVRVYLAGPLEGDWRDRVLARFGDDPRVHFRDPRTIQHLDDLDAIGAVECAWIESSHVVFAYAPADKRCVAGLAMELGWASGPADARWAHTILCDEHPRGWSWIGHRMDYHLDSLEPGLDVLQRLVTRRHAGLRAPSLEASPIGWTGALA